jgi:DNA-binding NtrC family response regulator
MLLLVDDDPSFLETAQAQLDAPRGIFLAGNAAQAKELMGSVGEAFSVVMIDLDLPDQDGFSLINELHRNFPDLPVIAISGVCKTDVLESAKLVGAMAALKKPITSEWNTAITLARHQQAG